jgi:hypothetical protein
MIVSSKIASPRSFGGGTVLFGSHGVEQEWRGTSELCYTDLPMVRAR